MFLYSILSGEEATKEKEHHGKHSFPDSQLLHVESERWNVLHNLSFVPFYLETETTTDVSKQGTPKVQSTFSNPDVSTFQI